MGSDLNKKEVIEKTENFIKSHDEGSSEEPDEGKPQVRFCEGAHSSLREEVAMNSTRQTVIIGVGGYARVVYEILINKRPFNIEEDKLTGTACPLSSLKEKFSFLTELSRSLKQMKFMNSLLSRGKKK